MATRSRTSFQKRQKELLRMEKQKEKAARRLQRKTEVKDPSDPDAWQADEFGVFPDGTLADGISPESISPGHAALRRTAVCRTALRRTVLRRPTLCRRPNSFRISTALPRSRRSATKGGQSWNFGTWASSSNKTRARSDSTL